MTEAQRIAGEWNDALRSQCEDDCAEYGDPACWELKDETGNSLALKPCADCLRACGFEVPDPIDPTAVVRPLL